MSLMSAMDPNARCARCVLGMCGFDQSQSLAHVPSVLHLIQSLRLYGYGDTDALIGKYF